jgi:translation initiation factor IF-2
MLRIFTPVRQQQTTSVAALLRRFRFDEGARPLATAATKTKMSSSPGNSSDRSLSARQVVRRETSKRRRPPAKSREFETQTVTIPHTGLTAKQFALLAGRSLDSVLSAAGELEPDFGWSEDAVMDVALVELLADSLEAPLVLQRQVAPLGTASQGRKSRPEQEWSKLPSRAPVVTIMGHVDVGKTTLLDALRSSNVADNEQGGITQSIGAFRVDLSGGGRDSSLSSVTFIDTPGHEAFKSMRAQGASATDVIVLVVAADDGVMPQTIEAVEHARSAGVPIVVAINKCDKEGADPERARYQLLDMAGISTEQLGGDVQCVEISAKSGLNLDGLIEAVLLQADLLDLRADPVAPAECICLETRVDRQLGQVASLIVRLGTLRVGDHFVHSSTATVTGEVFGRIRAMRDANGKTVKTAGPGDPVLVCGFRGSIQPGAELIAVAGGEREARLQSAHIVARNSLAQSTLDLIDDIERRMKEAQNKADISAEKDASMHSQSADFSEPALGTMKDAGSAGDESIRVAAARSSETAATDALDSPVPVLNVVVRADVKGVADAVTQVIERLSSDDRPIRMLSSGVGDVTENDVRLVSATRNVKKNIDESMIVAFNVRVSNGAMLTARRSSVDVLKHGLIYKLEEDIKSRNRASISVRLEREIVVGVAGCIRVFEEGAVAGCRVQDGGMKVGVLARVLRFPADKASTAREIVHEEPISSLKQFASDVQSVEKGSECGIGFVNWRMFKPGDVVECVEVVTGARRESGDTKKRKRKGQ